MHEIPQYIVTGLVTGSFYALVATSMQVVYGSSRILNFAQGEFVVFGMFAMWLLAASQGINPWLALAAVVVIGFLGGCVFFFVVVRPLDERPMLQTALATLAGGVILRGAFALIFGSDVHVVQDFIGGGPLHIGTVVVGKQSILVFCGSLVSLLVLFVIFRYTWIGLAMRATAESREGAEVTGANPRVISLIAFGVSGAISALAGGLMAPILGAEFDFGLNFVLIAFIAATLGGLTSTVGAAVGGLVLGMSIAVIAAAVGSEYQSVWLLLVVVPLLYFRPHGALGRLVSE